MACLHWPQSANFPTVPCEGNPSFRLSYFPYIAILRLPQLSCLSVCVVDDVDDHIRRFKINDQHWEAESNNPVPEINPYEVGVQHNLAAGPSAENEHRPDTYQRNSRSSWPGLLSLICGIATMVFSLVVMGFAMVLGSNPNAPLQADDPIAMLLGCSIFIVIGLATVGCILGVIGLFTETSKKRTFAIVGLLLNGLPIVGFGLCILVGLAIS